MFITLIKLISKKLISSCREFR